MANLGDMVVSIVGDTAGFDKSLTDTQKKMAGFAINVAAVTAAVVQTIKVIAKATKEYTDYGSQIDDARKRTGLSSEAIQEWKYIAEQAGTTLEAVTGSVALMTRGLETNKKRFEELGVATQNADGSFRSTTDIFNDTISALSNMQDETKRDQLAFQILGRSAQSLIPILKDGSAGLDAMKKEARDLGIILDADTITQADALGDAMLALNTSMKAAKLVIINDFAPAILTLALQFKETIDKTVSYRKELDAYKAAVQGTKLTQAQLTDAIRGTMAETASLEGAIANLEPGYEAQRDTLLKQVAASKALEQSLRAQAKAAASAAESNRLGTESAKAKAAADQAAADIANKAAADAQTNADNQKKINDEREAADRERLDFYGQQVIAISLAFDAIEASEAEHVASEKAAAMEVANAWAGAYTTMLEASKPVFEELGSSLVDGTFQWKNLGSVAINSIGKIITALGDQLAAEAAMDLVKAIATSFLPFPLNLAAKGYYSSAAIKGAGAGAAWATGGALSAIQLEEGGVVMPKSGGTLAQIAEAGQPEAVIPLDKLGSIGGDIHLVVNMDSKPFLDKIFPATQNRTILISAGAVV